MGADRYPDAVVAEARRLAGRPDLSADDLPMWCALIYHRCQHDSLPYGDPLCSSGGRWPGRPRVDGGALAVPFEAPGAPTVCEAWTSGGKLWPTGSRTLGLVHGLQHLPEQWDAPDGVAELHVVEGARDVWALAAAGMHAIGVTSAPAGWPTPDPGPAIRSALARLSPEGRLVVHAEPGGAADSLIVRAVTSEACRRWADGGRIDLVDWDVAVPALSESGLSASDADPAGWLAACRGDTDGLSAAVSELREAVPAGLADRLRPDPPRRRPRVMSAPPPSKPGRGPAFLEGCVAHAEAKIAAHENGRSNAVYGQARNVGQFMHLDPSNDPTERLVSAGVRVGLSDREARSSVRSGLKKGTSAPQPMPEGKARR